VDFQELLAGDSGIVVRYGWHGRCRLSCWCRLWSGHKAAIARCWHCSGLRPVLAGCAGCRCAAWQEHVERAAK